jgi:CheY-like chemotaxis protein
VDDDEDTLELYAWCMRAAGWHVDTAANAAEALTTAVASTPDVIVMDLHMPVMSGVQAAQMLKHDPRTAHVPIVACTAYWKGFSAAVKGATFHGVIEKPCTPEDVLAYVERLLRTRE